MTCPRQDPASFRDQAGHVYDVDGRILRSVTLAGYADYAYLRDNGILKQLIEDGSLIASDEMPVSELPGIEAAAVLEHPRLPFISYPYEWSFAALRKAALLTLEVHLKALQRGATLVDASAFNIQFVGTHPLFIDVLSLRPYEEGEYWRAQAQFCEHFLNPLLLGAIWGIPHNDACRGRINGFASDALCSQMPWHWKLKLPILINLILPQYFQRRITREGLAFDGEKLVRRKLPKANLIAMLSQLHDFIQDLRMRRATSIWSPYEQQCTYTAEEEKCREETVARFVAETQPKTLWDIGCNTGVFGEVALRAGVKQVFGFDADPTSVDLAFGRAEKSQLNFLPLVMDATNPSASLGWRQQERKGLQERVNADGLIALGFIHHLAIGQNIPLADVVDWLISLAPTGIIEFVPKSDPTCQFMLTLRKGADFHDYTEEAFSEQLSKHGRIVETQVSSKNGRRLYRYSVHR